MKRLVFKMAFVVALGAATSFPAFAAEKSNYELMRELEETRARLEQLEKRVGASAGPVGAGGDRPLTGAAGVKGLDDRVGRIEEALEGAPLLGKWADRITLSGAIEVEAGYEHIDFDDPAADDEDASDLVLATAELGVDAVITEHVSGHAVFLWEEDADGVDLDEGFIILDGGDLLPIYLNVGRMYVPFGNFESHFISDPLTLEIGETGESAVKAGFVNDWTEVSISIFNGDVDEIGDDNHIKGFAGGAIFSLPEGAVPDFGLMAGVSYISNIADSGGLEGETPGEIEDYVGGLGTFLSISFQERFFLEAEFVTALDHFKPGELSFDGGEEREPRAWNLEFAFAPMEDLEVALRYEGSDDTNDFLPEAQLGGVISYGIFENTSLALEYLHGEFENNDERDLLTAQFGLEF
jgi:hypothetical protein